MQQTKPSRPDEATLILAKDLADEVLSSPVITAGERFQMHIHLSPGSRARRLSSRIAASSEISSECSATSTCETAT